MNVYNIYLVSKYKRLNVYQNVNIYGKQYPNMNLFFTTEIDLDKDGKISYKDFKAILLY